ncbi:hypothetical protein SLEP1_g18968 [Rubroshorea leprosula]|uniref:Retrotransposon gag domain-containing protein n=1 Tax=Rubroshorea leprosula TaxID=152421 RepID=A0AAV5J869_9ROSI|nr:hypothetical protein SLEP1_g18968 [Rubroshorea leprosula]
MPITRATSSHIANGNQKQGQDDGQKDYPALHQHSNATCCTRFSPTCQCGWKISAIRSPHWATDENGGPAARPDSSTPSTVVVASIDRAPPNADDSAQGFVTMADFTVLLDREHSRHGTTLFYVVEHASKFLDAMGAHAGDKDLCLHEFSKSLFDKAYTCEERITILDLHNTRQPTGEDLMAYVKRFRDLALDCYSGHAESFLVEICINNMFSKYRAVLEKIGITSPSPIPLIVEELDVLLDQWIIDGAITLPQLHREPNDDDKHHPKATESILTIANETERECLNVEAHTIRAYLKSSNAITFTDEDMEAPYPNHRKPLYLSAQINSVGVKCVLVDARSSLNLRQLSTITTARISQ